MDYQNADLVRVAKRENNKKRSYLVINRLQGKHIPAKPDQALAMFRALAGKVQGYCVGERTLVIGFAETATAIGAAVAAELGAYYIQTTREDIAGAEYFYFSEAHSHAAQQRLVKGDLDRIMPKIDHVIFAEDEITTGNTILNLVNILEKEYPKQAAYAAASVLNGMDEQALELYESRNIGIYYLVKTEHQNYPQAVLQYSRKGIYRNMTVEDTTGNVSERLDLKDPDIKEITADGWMDARRLVSARAYEKASMSLWSEIDRCMHKGLTGRILVLGTEEFMYPALVTADRIAQNGAQVWFHATTRSPIEVYEEEEYPLHVRYELPSLYDKFRRTFVYDLGTYDVVLIITDAHNTEREGLDALIQAAAVNNSRIYVIRWY